MSNERNDGGPAFPYLTASECDREVTTHEGEHGMSLRDYFIAHAPAEPQPWFTPKMPECPPHRYVSDDLRRHYASCFDAERECGDSFHDENREAIYAWETERDKQRYVQWPAAWADEMLKARQS